MTTTMNTPCGKPPGDADADTAIRELYSRYATALHRYAERFGPDSASADDIVQETFIRAWRHLAQLTSDGRPGPPVAVPGRPQPADRRRTGRPGTAGHRPNAADRGRDR